VRRRLRPDNRLQHRVGLQPAADQVATALPDCHTPAHSCMYSPLQSVALFPLLNTSGR
jgi:hypothetical protein